MEKSRGQQLIDFINSGNSVKDAFGKFSMRDVTDNSFSDYDINDLLKFAVVVTSYYMERTQEFTARGYLEENIKKQLSVDEVKFLIGDEQYKSTSRSIRGSATKAILPMWAYLQSHSGKVSSNFLQKEDFIQLKQQLSETDKPADKREFSPYAVSVTLLETGETGVFTESVYDEALRYMEENNIHPSHMSLKLTARAIAFGHIKTEDQPQE